MANDTQSMDKLKGAGQDLMKAAGEKALSSVGHRVSGLTDKFDGIANGGGSVVGKAVAGGTEAAASGDSKVGGALKGAATGLKDKLTGGGGGSKTPKATKAMNIVEQIDVGVPIRVAYNQWTEYDGFPSFMKKVENVDPQSDDEPKTTWKAQVFWSHREWEATVIEQYPDDHIVWRSKGAKGHVDGAVTFHELGPTLTRILIDLEYYPQGLFERTGNLWRAQGRRARLEIKHFRRHVMTRTILDPDEVEGWRGTIEDSEIVKTHEEALEEEQQQDEEQSDEAEYDEGEGSEDAADEEEYEEPEDEADSEPEEAEEEGDAEPEEEAEAEYDEEAEAAEPEEEEAEPEEEEAAPPPPKRRRRAS